MKFYEKYFESNFDELITYYPRFYRGVFEMVEILKAHGRIADELEANIEQTYLNSFIDHADEETISKLEKFLMIGLNKSRTLEERRRLVKSYFVGFGKVSATMLEEMIASYTGAEVNSRFEPSDEEGNNTLYIDFKRGEEPTLYIGDIYQLLSKKIPAHINWQAAVTYQFAVGVGVRRTHYKYGYDLCGTKPEIAMLGAIVSRETVTKTKRLATMITLRQATEENELTGTHPEIASIGSLVAVRSVVEANRQNYTNEYEKASEEAQEAGKRPIAATLGSANEINTAAGVKSTSYGVDYIYCGTRQSQS